MKHPTYPSLYQINTRVWLTELSHDLGRRATLADIPDVALDRIADMGFDWVWFLSVWSTGEQGRKVSREHPEFRRDFEATLHDLCDDDIAGSGFAIADYKVHPDLGGDEGLSQLRTRLKKRRLKLMLDFVPNHMGPDHSWVLDHPDYLVSGTTSDLEKYPQNYKRATSRQGEIILAYGRDPYFAGWPDTVQLDYGNPATVKAMMNELLRIASQCDGIRCDMAMLVLPEVFKRTWGRAAQAFWSTATVNVRERFPDFVFMAEVYWDMEWAMQQQGFDYAYDKRLYDRLLEGNPQAVHGHFCAEQEYQDKLARFLENHDEPRAASTMEHEKHKAAAVITFLSPGLRFFHQGQFEGRKKRISPHLVRAPLEAIDNTIQEFYKELLGLLKKPIFRDGHWQLLNCISAWQGNNTYNAFLAFAWQKENGSQAVVSVNYAPHASQCFVHLPFSNLCDKSVQLRDMLSSALYDREGNDLLARGLFLDLPAWGFHVFEIN